MAEHNSVQYAKTQADTVQSDPLKTTEKEGRVRLAVGELVGGDQTLAQNDTLVLFTLPKGARPLSYFATHGAFGASVVLDIGDGSDADRFVDGDNIAAAGAKSGALLDVGELTEETTFVATFLGANPADDQDLVVIVQYVVD